jgi:pyruvate/2-oxoglutarate dehydrogenase complex dihydrolipoamide dehydrogenase (E3) component
LAHEGRDVTVVEMLGTLCPDANGRHRPLLLAEMEKTVTAHTGMRGIRIGKDGLVCADRDGGEILFAADTVVVAVGQRALRSVADSLRDSAPEVYEIGDCVRPAQVTQAVFRAILQHWTYE